MNEKISLLIITVPVGAGKSSVSEAVSQILSKKKVPNAVIDMDNLTCAYPHPENDRFNSALGYKNLSSIWPNYKKLGIRNLIIPTVIENQEAIRKYKSAVPNSHVTVVRLTAGDSTLHKRLEHREVGDSLKWHKNRAGELREQFERCKLEDFVIDTENKSIAEVAEEVLPKWFGE
jgi:adenylylsulfate kinase-like enzyme